MRRGALRQPEQRLREDAQALARAGCFTLVLEAMPAEAAAYITERVSVPTIGIGGNSVIQGAIVDKNARIGSGVRVVNESGAESSDEVDGCMIVDGIPVVIKDSTLPDGWRLP